MEQQNSMKKTKMRWVYSSGKNRFTKTILVINEFFVKAKQIGIDLKLILM